MSETEVERGDEDSEERRGSRFCHQLCHGLVNAIKRCSGVTKLSPTEALFDEFPHAHSVTVFSHSLADGCYKFVPS